MIEHSVYFDEHDIEDQVLLWQRAQAIAQNNSESELARIENEDFDD